MVHCLPFLIAPTKDHLKVFAFSFIIGLLLSLPGGLLSSQPRGTITFSTQLAVAHTTEGAPLSQVSCISQLQDYLEQAWALHHDYFSIMSGNIVNSSAQYFGGNLLSTSVKKSPQDLYSNILGAFDAKQKPGTSSSHATDEYESEGLGFFIDTGNRTQIQEDIIDMPSDRDRGSSNHTHNESQHYQEFSHGVLREPCVQISQGLDPSLVASVSMSATIPDTISESSCSDSLTQALSNIMEVESQAAGSRSATPTRKADADLDLLTTPTNPKKQKGQDTSIEWPSSCPPWISEVLAQSGRQARKDLDEIFEQQNLKMEKMNLEQSESFKNSMAETKEAIRVEVQSVRVEVQSVKEEFAVVKGEVKQMNAKFHETTRDVTALGTRVRSNEDKVNQLLQENEQLKLGMKVMADKLENYISLGNHVGSAASAVSGAGSHGPLHSPNTIGNEKEFRFGTFMFGGWDWVPSAIVEKDMKTILVDFRIPGPYVKGTLSFEIKVTMLQIGKPRSSYAFIEFDSHDGNNSMAIGWTLKKAIDEGAKGTKKFLCSGSGKQAWCQPCQPKAEIALRKLLNHGRRACHLYRESKSLPVEIEELGVPIKLVGGSYAAGNQTVAFGKTTVLTLEGGRLIIASDEQLSKAFSPYISNFQPAEFKAHWTTYVANNPGAN